MQVHNLSSYFKNSCFDVPGGISSSFKKESDIDRIIKNKKPLYINDDQSIFSSIESPFSFENISTVLFESVGNVLVLDRTNTFYIALRPCDSLERCLEIIGTKADQIIYRTKDGSENNTVVSNIKRSLNNENKIAMKIWDNMWNVLNRSLLRSIQPINTSLIIRKVHLASFLYPPLPKTMDEFYFALCSIFENHIKNDVCMTTTTTTTTNHCIRSIGFIYDEYDKSILIPTIFKEDILYVQGHPIKRKTLFKTIETSLNSPPSNEFSNYQIVLTTGISVTLPRDSNRFSKVISSICHIERFGHFTNEREIALEYQKQRYSLQYETNVQKLRNHRNRDYDDRPLPWTSTYHRIKRRNVPCGTIPLVSDIDYTIYDRNEPSEPIDFNDWTALNGLTEEIPMGIVSPFDALRWQINEMCFYQGSRFMSQFYTFDENPSEKDTFFLSITYALFSGILSDDSFNSMELEYGHTRPSLDSYKWYLTYDGILYFKRMTRKDLYKNTKRTKNLENEDNDSPSVELHQKPCFLEDIDDMDEDDSGDNRQRNVKKWTGKYSNNKKIRDRFKNVSHDRKSPELKIHDDNDESENNDGNTITENKRFYDPCVLRKYDGRGLFPVFVSENELQTKRDQNQIVFDSDKFLSQDGFFKLHNGYKTMDTKGVNESVHYPKKMKRCMKDMIDFVSFFIQYTNLCCELFSDDDEKENDESCDLSEYPDYYTTTTTVVHTTSSSNKDDRKKSKTIEKKDSTIKNVCIRGVDYDYIQREIFEMLLPKGARLNDDIRYHESNPLWIQCCVYICSREFRFRTICMTYENVPKTIDDIHFILNYHRIRCEPVFSMCLGYYSPAGNMFLYNVFECVVETNRGIEIPNRFLIYKVTYETVEEKRYDDKLKLKVTKRMISNERFCNILDASVFFVINSGF